MVIKTQNSAYIFLKKLPRNELAFLEVAEILDLGHTPTAVKSLRVRHEHCPNIFKNIFQRKCLEFRFNFTVSI